MLSPINLRKEYSSTLSRLTQAQPSAINLVPILLFYGFSLTIIQSKNLCQRSETKKNPSSGATWLMMKVEQNFIEFIITYMYIYDALING